MQNEARDRLGNSFRLKCFNDKLLSFGLLPLSLTSVRMKNELFCNN